MPTEVVMLPPQTDKTREWGRRLAAALPELKVVVAENTVHAAAARRAPHSRVRTVCGGSIRNWVGMAVSFPRARLARAGAAL